MDVEGLDLDGPSDLAARQLRVVVRVVGGTRESDAESLSEVHEPRDAVDESLFACS